METTVKLYSLNFLQAKTYWFTLLFVAGNLILPQLCHLIPQGGLILLPIYFFTLIAAYKFGIRVGLLTAVLSPLANSALFGMPAAAVLPEILIKSVTLAVAAAMAARYLKNVSMLAMVAVVLAYQIIGSLFEWVLTGSFLTAMQDFRLGVPGMLLQIVAGYALLKWLAKR